MKKKKELLERRDALKKELKAQLDAFQAMEGGPSETDWATYNKKKTELEKVDEELVSIERIEQEIRANAETRTSISNPHDLAGDKPFASLGEQLLAVARAQSPGGTVDPRLHRLAASGASEKVGADGGFLVQQDFNTSLLAKAQEQAVIAPKCTSIPLTSNSNSIKLPFVKETSRATGSRWGGVRVYRRDEAATVTAAKPTFDYLELKAEPLMGLAYVTDELMDDAPAVETVLGNAFASEFAFVIDDEILNGTGAGQCLGVLNAACLVSQAKETGQAAATVVAENISKMWARIPPRSKPRGSWFINSEITPQLDQLNFSVGTAGQLVYMPPNGLAGAPLGTLKGRPIVEIEQAAALGTVGDIIFADFSEYLLVTKGGLTGSSSIHVRFLYNEMTFRWNLRIIGQPTWTSAITQYKGSATQSPFVALATRA